MFAVGSRSRRNLWNPGCGRAPKLDLMTETAAVGDDQVTNSDVSEKRWPFLRRHARTVVYCYATVLLVVISIQALCLVFLWRPPQDWISFGARLATSPAMAGAFAVIAASIGAWQLSKQLTHTKEKAADEAWWQQFEWVTDRIISPGQKGETNNSALPSSLAFDLMTSLSKVARAPFQKDAVGGILNHYVKYFPKEHGGSREHDETQASAQSGEREEAPTTDGPSMDAAGANSLRNLLNVLPQSSPSIASARRVLEVYDSENYEQEIAKALRHQGFDVVLPGMKKPTPGDYISEADLIATIDSKKIIADVKLSLRTRAGVERAGREIRKLMDHERATHGVIITPPTEAGPRIATDLALQGIHLVEWEPSMRSHELRRRIEGFLADTKA